MSYGTLPSVKARHDLARIGNIELRRQVLRQLKVLGEDPSLLSKPSHFPFREKCRIYALDYECGRAVWEVFILFSYSQDEQDLYIIEIGFAQKPING
jgi:hypothetical protein